MLSLLDALSIRMLQKAALTNFNTPSLDCGASPQFSKARRTNSNIAPRQIARIRNMLPTYHRTPWSSSHLSQSMAPTLDTVNSISLSKQAHTRRPESKGSNHRYHLKSRPTTSQLTVPLPFTGLASQNSTTTLLRSNGCRRMNAVFTFQVTQSRTSRSCIRVPLSRRQLILHLLFLNSPFSLDQSFKALTDSSSFRTVSVQTKHANGV